jgi:hypothetical protein
MFRFLKREMRNWAAINLLLCGLGRIGEIPYVRKKAMRMGLSGWGAAMDSSVGSKLFGRRRAETGISSLMTACATLGTGAGLMYLFDPDRGARRRARLKDKGVHAINKTGAATRLLAALTGGVLIGLCLRRRDAIGAVAGTLGFGLILRDATNLETGHPPQRNR